MHGDENKKLQLIYDPVNNEITEHQYESNKDIFDAVSVFVYKNRIIKLAGYNISSWTQDFVDTFIMSSEIKANDKSKIVWTEKPEWKLPKAAFGFGHVLYGDYLIILGGATSGPYLDSLYVLDLSSDDNEWQELKYVKCPMKSKFLATIGSDNHIHLFTEINKWPDWQESDTAHYSIPISTILGSAFTR